MALLKKKFNIRPKLILLGAEMAECHALPMAAWKLDFLFSARLVPAQIRNNCSLLADQHVSSVRWGSPHAEGRFNFPLEGPSTPRWTCALTKVSTRCKRVSISVCRVWNAMSPKPSRTPRIRFVHIPKRPAATSMSR